MDFLRLCSGSIDKRFEFPFDVKGNDRVRPYTTMKRYMRTECDDSYLLRVSHLQTANVRTLVI
jgi:hypothetical protein